MPPPDGCGDEAVAGDEECDDGNNAAGDGCSPVCTHERQCLVSSVGGSRQVTFHVAPLDYPGIFAQSEQSLVVPGFHEPDVPQAGPDLLASCGGFVFAVLSGTSEIVTLGPADDGRLAELHRVPLPAEGALRAIECHPATDTLLAIRTVDRPTAGEPTELLLHGLSREPSGELVPVTGPELRTVATSIDYEALRTASNGDGSIVYVGYDQPGPSGNVAYFLRVDVGSAGAITVGDPVLTDDIRLELGDLAMSPDGSRLVVAGTRQAMGGDVRPTSGSFGILPDGTIDFASGFAGGPMFGAWANATSVAFAVRAQTGEALAVLGHPGTTAQIADFAAAPPINLAAVQTAFDDTRSVNFTFSDEVLVLAGPGRAIAYDFTVLPNNVTDSEITSRVLPADPELHASVLVPCPRFPDPR